MDFIRSEHVEAELLFEFLRIIDGHNIIALELENTIPLGGNAKGGGNLRHKKTFAGASAYKTDLLLVSTRFGTYVNGDGGMTATDTEIAVLNHDGKRYAGFVPTLGALPEATNRAKKLQLIHVALLQTVHFGKVVERFICKLNVGHAFQN